MTAHETFVEALDRHRGILFKVATAYCADRAGREDLIQDMIVQLWRAYRRFDGRAKFSTWMYRIAMNVAISFHRTQRRKGDDSIQLDEAIIETTPAPDPQADDRLALVHDLIERLDDLNRALMLLYLDDLQYSEIAQILGISETNVATKISRLKQHLKRLVAARGNEIRR
jgi:RNA polymerase sigma factor (sigma-70 family)